MSEETEFSQFIQKAGLAFDEQSGRLVVRRAREPWPRHVVRKGSFEPDRFLVFSCTLYDTRFELAFCSKIFPRQRSSVFSEDFELISTREDSSFLEAKSLKEIIKLEGIKQLKKPRTAIKA